MISTDITFTVATNEEFFPEDSWDNIIRENRKIEAVAKSESTIRPSTFEPHRRPSRRNPILKMQMDVFGTEFWNVDPWTEDKSGLTKSVPTPIANPLEKSEGQTNTPTLSIDTNSGFPIGVWEAGTGDSGDKGKTRIVNPIEKGFGEKTRSSSRGRRPRRGSGSASENHARSSSKGLDERPSRFLTSEEVSLKRRSRSQSAGRGARRNSPGRRGRSKSVQRAAKEVVDALDSHQQDGSNSVQRTTTNDADPKDTRRRGRSSSVRRRREESVDPKGPRRRSRSGSVRRRREESVDPKGPRRRSRSGSVQRITTKAEDSKDARRPVRSRSLQRMTTSVVDPGDSATSTSSPPVDGLILSASKHRHGRRNSIRMRDIQECQVQRALSQAKSQSTRESNAISEGSPVNFKELLPESRKQQQNSPSPPGRSSRSITSSRRTSLSSLYRAKSDQQQSDRHSESDLRRLNVKSALNKFLTDDSEDNTNQPWTVCSPRRASSMTSASQSSRANSSMSARLQKSTPHLSSMGGDRSIASAPGAPTGSTSNAHPSLLRRGTRVGHRSKSQSSLHGSRQRSSRSLA